MPLAAVLLAALGAASSPASPPHEPFPPETGAAVDLLPRPCALEGNDPYERASTEAEGWEGPDYERYPGACQRLRFSFGPIARQAGPERRPDRAGHDREAAARRLHHPLRAEPRATPTARCRRSSRSTSTTAPGSRCPSYGSGPFFAAGEEKTIAPFPTRLRDAGQGDRPVAAALHGPLGGPAADGGLHHLRHRLRPQGRRPRSSGMQARLSASGSTCARPATRSSTSSALRRQRRQVHLAEGGVRRASTRGASRSSARASRATARARTCDLPERGRAARRDRQLQRRHPDRHRRPPAPGRAAERDRPRPRRQGAADLHRASRLLGRARNPQSPAGRRPRGTSRCGSPGCPYWGVRVEARRHPAQQRHLRHDDPVDLREHGHRGRAARPDTPDGKPTAPGVDPFKAPGRHARRAASRGGLQGQAPDALRQGHRGHPRPPARERQLRRRRGHVGRASRGRRPSDVDDRRLPLRARATSR